MTTNLPAEPPLFNYLQHGSMLNQRPNQTEPPAFDLELMKQTLASHCYEYKKRLGKGSFATVHLVNSTRYGCDFAVKVSVKPPDLNEKEASSEIETLTTLAHCYVIRIYEYFTDAKYIYMVLEYCEGGSLDDLVRNRGALSGPSLIQACRQSCLALKACHDRHVAHRDIKPANLLLDQYGRVKLADFGLSTPCLGGKLIKQQMGSRAFMAPEIIAREAYDPFKADIWALGVTFYVLVMGKLPWCSESMKELELAISIGMVDFGRGSFDTDLAKVIRAMLTIDARRRPDIDWVLAQEVLSTPPMIAAKRFSSVVPRLKQVRGASTLAPNPLPTAVGTALGIPLGRAAAKSDETSETRIIAPGPILRCSSMRPKHGRWITGNGKTPPLSTFRD